MRGAAQRKLYVSLSPASIHDISGLHVHNLMPLVQEWKYNDNMIDTRLHSLLKVYETGSFTKAAQELSLTQPAVSQHIRSLENALNVQIFERHNNVISLTREGELVVQYAKRVNALYSTLLEELSSETSILRVLTVGITHTAESNQIAAALAGFANAHENLTVKMITNSIDNLYAMLKNYELDFVIADGRINDPSLQHMMLDTDYLVLAVPPSHRLSKRSMVTLDELKKEKLILRLPNSNTRNLFIASLESQNLRIDDFNVVLEIDNVATIKDLIRHDFGVSVLPKSVCLDELKKKKINVLPIENLTMIREINLVCTKDFRYPELLQEIAQEYVKTKSVF